MHKGHKRQCPQRPGKPDSRCFGAARCKNVPFGAKRLKVPPRGVKLSHSPSRNRPVSKAGGAECGPLEVEVPLDAELVELILSWHELPEETKILVSRHFHDL